MDKWVDLKIRSICADVKEYHGLDEKPMVDFEVSLDEAIRELVKRMEVKK